MTSVSPPPSASHPGSGAMWGENEAALLDTFVVPSYLRLYWELLKRPLVYGEASRVVHLGCLTGYPDGEMLSMMPKTNGVGVDTSVACLGIAGAKMDAFGFDYLHATPEATGLPSDHFSHALLIHPPGRHEERQALISEMARLVYAGGQVLIGLPLSGSFPEIIDLLNEYALKFDLAEMELSLEGIAAGGVTEQVVAEELASQGLSDISWEVESATLTFDSGRALLEDPAYQLLIAPQLHDWLQVSELDDALQYVGRAIDKYWSDEPFELGIRLAAVSARA